MYIALDIGGTNCRIVASTDINSPLLDNIVKFSMENNYSNDIAKIIDTIKSLNNGNNIDSIGIGFGAVLSHDKRYITVSANLPDWVNKPFVGDLEKAFSCKVILQHDAYVAALVEAIYGEGKDKDFLFVVWGTGIGGAAVKHIDSKIYIESFELGHQAFDWNGEECSCGQKGCVKLKCSGKSIERIYQTGAKDIQKHEWDEVLEVMSHTLYNTLMIRPVDLIIFGGGIAINQEEKIKNIEKILKERMTFYKAPTLSVSKYGDNLGLYGAFALLK